jgi:hypothetical protein
MTRSKWLDWTPEISSVGFEGSDPVGNLIVGAFENAITPAREMLPDKIMENAAQGEPTKPTDLGFVGFEGVASVPSSESERESDPYAERMAAAIQQINQPDYPGGMISWLDSAHPKLYQELTSLIPDQVDRLWNEGVALGEFEATLDRLVAVHREACRLFREAQERRRTEDPGNGRLLEGQDER